jgi:hypothetical protein
MFDERIPALANIADGDGTTAADRIRALDLLGRVGLGGTTISIEDLRGRLSAQTEAIQKHLGAGAPALLDKLSQVGSEPIVSREFQRMWWETSRFILRGKQRRPASRSSNRPGVRLTGDAL